MLFFFKQKTAYDIRPRDWRSGVCSYDPKDDYGTEGTDTNISDWSDPLQELKPSTEGRAMDKDWEE